jgi:hypothetical protein
MDASTVGAAAIVLGFATATMAATDGSFRRVRLPPPPLGVLNLFDVAVMIGMVVAVPYLYLLVPTPLVTVLLVLAVASILHLALEPVATRPIRWVIVVVILGAELVAFWSAGPGSVTFAAVNNVVVCLVAAATANLWAQSGLSAQRAAVLAGALTVYDLVFTTFLGVTGDLFDEALDHPFPPVIAWPVADGDGQVGLGQGDLLFAAVFPIIARKAYGARAATIAFTSTVAVFVVLLALGITENLPTTFPVMVVLGPVQVALWLHFHRTYGAERTMAQYRQPAIPTPSPVDTSPQ